MKLFKIYQEKIQVPAPTAKNPNSTKNASVTRREQLEPYEARCRIKEVINSNFDTISSLLAAFIIEDKEKVEEIIMVALTDNYDYECREWDTKTKQMISVSYEVEF